MAVIAKDGTIVTPPGVNGRKMAQAKGSRRGPWKRYKKG